ncbi:MAG: pyridoxamine 5'-phosphate oxidase family protein [Nitriliruptoraceae bacterium]|nr:pyridoxamine 5'-phosphate oxidase family protein [Nitriliruptoraceae bacterium]
MTPTSDAQTRVRRASGKQRHDRAELDAVLDAAQVAHVAVVDDRQPYVLPMAAVRDGDRLLLHGSTGSRLMRRLAEGAPTCATVTVLDGLVVARSAFESSMHYRSAMVFGVARPVDDPVEALDRLTDGLLPGRVAEVRASTRRELAATSILALPLERWSVKVSDGPPEDDERDLDGPAWAGVIPIETSYGAPKPAPDLRDGIEVPASVRALAGPTTP